MPGRVDEPGSTAAELPPLDRAYEIDFRLLSDRLAEIPDDVNGVLKLFDGSRTLALVLAEADRRGLAAAGIVARLWSEEIIRPTRGPAPGTAASTSRALRAEAAAGDGAVAQPAEWFRSPAGGDAAPAPPAAPDGPTAAPAAAGGAEVPPRIVRFPAKRKDEAPPVPDALTVHLLEGPPLPAARLQAASQRAVVRRPVPARDARRRSAAALLLAAALVAVAIWRMVASHSPEPEEGVAASTSTSPASAATPVPATAHGTAPSSPAAQPARSREPASTR